MILLNNDLSLSDQARPKQETGLGTKMKLIPLPDTNSSGAKLICFSSFKKFRFEFEFIAEHKFQ